MFTDAIGDIVEGARLAPLWLSLGWQQTVSRFRRTLLGPFWLSANLLAISIALTVLFGGLLGGNTRTTFTSMISGLLAWSLIGGPLGESGSVFISSAGMMQTHALPLSFHIYLMMFRAVINFLAQLIALWAAFLLFRVGAPPAWPILIGLPLVLANSFFLSLVMALPATRFRDVSQMVTFVIQIVFFLTPVFWSESQVGPRYRFLVEYNPLAHLLELIRQPLLGRVPAPEHFGWGFCLLFVLAGIAIVELALYRKRVVYWL